MNKIVTISLFIVFLALSACRMQDLDNPGNASMTFYAMGESGTRTSLGLNGSTWGSIYWSPADAIHIFYGDMGGRFVSTNTEKTRSRVEFVGTLPDFERREGPSFWAVYPYSDNTVFSGDAVELELPAEQPAVEGNVKEGLLLSMARSQDQNLYFYNLCSFLSTAMPEEGIKKIVFKGNNGEPLAGRVQATFDASGAPVISKFISPRTEITLLPPEGETFKMDRDYYLVSFPASFERGYTVEFYRDKLVSIKQYDTPVQLSRARLVTLGVNTGGIIYSREWNGKTYSVRYKTESSSVRYWVTIDGKEIPVPEAFRASGFSVTRMGPAVAIDTETETVHFALAQEDFRGELSNGVVYEISSSDCIRQEWYVGYYPYFRMDEGQQRLELHSFSKLGDWGENRCGYSISYHDVPCHSWVLRYRDGCDYAASGYYTKQVPDALLLCHEPRPDPPSVTAVDLGLSVLWADRNLGAPAPEIYGSYYAWGEIAPKMEYTEWSYRFSSGEKYSPQDRKLQLDPEDDAAHVLLGENWRIPSPQEWDELIEKCSWEWTSLNGVAGGRLTSKINGKSIFLPAAGYRSGLQWEGDIHEMGFSGMYHSSRLYKDAEQYAMSYLGLPEELYLRGSSREEGLPIRPVFAAPAVPVTQVILDKAQVKLDVGETVTLAATVLPENATDKSVRWSSDNDSVATVSSSGVVTGLSAGSTTVTVTTADGEKKASCIVTVKAAPGPIVEPRAIDLGLSVRWASFNLGASAPEGIGNYYAWGEVDVKDAYSWATYRYGSNSRNLTKYCTDSGYGTVDGLVTLESADDAAATHLQGHWRMPTEAEFRELVDQCEWQRIPYLGQDGYLVKGPSGNAIFLPAAGSSEGQDGYGNAAFGYYWTSTIDPDSRCRPYYLFFSEAYGVGLYNNGARYVGATVRPVYAVPFNHVESVSLDVTSMDLYVGSNRTLRATILPNDAANLNLTWSSSDETVATVSSSGKVTGISEGTATITVRSDDGGKAASCSVKVKSPSALITEPGKVDMGLSVAWASCNLGASSPEEYGNYYAWGETEPKESYYIESYKWGMGAFSTMIKYCSDSESGYNGFVDNKEILDFEDDAAYVQLGADWRMPTRYEWSELRDNCTWTWTTELGVGGYKVTSNINGNQIFFPIGGYYLRKTLMASHEGCYWSSELGSSTSAFSPSFWEEDTLWQYSAHRYLGQAIRPVSPTPSTQLIIDQPMVVGKVGDRRSFSFTTVPERASRSFICSVSDESVVKLFVSWDNWVFFDLLSPGTAYITVTSRDGGATNRCKIVVEE